MGGWQVEEATTRESLDLIATAIVDHSDQSRHAFFPLLGDRESGIARVKQQLWDEHSADPASHWIFVRPHQTSPPSTSPSSTSPSSPTSSNTDDESDTTTDDGRAPPPIIGACQWRFYHSNPFQAGVPSLDNLQATWWPEGSSGRDFATQITAQVVIPRAKHMNRPHAGMSWMFVLSDYRRQGIGAALMQWGMRRADEMRLESFIEATRLGHMLYEACGYRQVSRKVFEVVPLDESGRDEEWMDLERRVLPLDISSLWRPVGGRWEEDEPARTWEGRFREGDVVWPDAAY